jgi:hypothetical protein
MGDGHRRQIAERVLESTHTFTRWESGHSRLMKAIVNERNTDRQILAVKRIALSLIHSKAPFEALRAERIVGKRRRLFLLRMFGTHDYASSMVREHRTYLHSGCSYLCCDRFCGPRTAELILDYEQCYSDYMRTRSTMLLTDEQSSEVEPLAALLACERTRLSTARQLLLDTAPTAADTLTMEELRRPTGDTVRMRTIFSPYYESGHGSAPTPDRMKVMDNLRLSL